MSSMSSHSPLSNSSYRGRVAPSPTGYLHVGHARTFWTAWQRARDAGGVLVLRMEDLDPDRSRAVYADAAIEDLRWLGIRWQEGPDKGGPFVPYVQSRRRASYLAAWRKLRTEESSQREGHAGDAPTTLYPAMEPRDRS